MHDRHLTRLRKETLLQSPVRASLLKRIRRTPGINGLALARQLNLHPSTVTYHVELLTVFGFIEVRSAGNQKFHFDTGRFSRREMDRLGKMRSPVARKIRTCLRRTGRISITRLAGHVGLRRQTVSWHLRKLKATKQIRVERKGREALVQWIGE